MKPTPKQKIQKGLKFIDDLKLNPRIVPFLEPDDIQRLGLFDFRFVTRRTMKLALIETKIKEGRYNEFQELISDIKLVFQMIGFYVPLTDPLQNQVKYFLVEIDRWKVISEGGSVIQESQASAKQGQKSKGSQQAIRQCFNKNQKHYESQREKKIKNYATLQEQKQKIMQVTKAYRLPVRSTLAQKLQMVYFLKSHQNNEPFIHMIGDMYGIGKQTEDEYVIKLDNSTCCSWLEVLQNNNNQMTD